MRNYIQCCFYLHFSNSESEYLSICIRSNFISFFSSICLYLFSYFSIGFLFLCPSNFKSLLYSRDISPLSIVMLQTFSLSFIDVLWIYGVFSHVEIIFILKKLVIFIASEFWAIVRKLFPTSPLKRKSCFLVLVQYHFSRFDPNSFVAYSFL